MSGYFLSTSRSSPEVPLSAAFTEIFLSTSVRCLPRIPLPISTVLFGLSGLTNINLVVSTTLQPSHRNMPLPLKEEEERSAVKHHNDKFTMTGRKRSDNLTGHLANASGNSIYGTKVLAQYRTFVLSFCDGQNDTWAEFSQCFSSMSVTFHQFCTPTFHSLTNYDIQS